MDPLKIDVSNAHKTPVDHAAAHDSESCDSSAFIVQSPTTTTMSQANRNQSFGLPSGSGSFGSSGSANNFTESPAHTLSSLNSTDQNQLSSGGFEPFHRHEQSTEPQNSSQRNSLDCSQPTGVKETLDATITETKDGHLRLKQYVLKHIIGQGAYGIVNLGEDAIKEFSKSKLSKKDRTSAFRYGRGRGKPNFVNSAKSSPLDMIKSEIAILKKLDHVNIVKLYEVLDVAKGDSMFMVFELCERGVLTDVTLSDKPGKIFDDEECRDVFQQMILGIEYLHDHDIIHRDIKPDNLLRSADGTLKIVDFGVSEMFSKKGYDVTSKSAGSPAFMAPEWCRHDHGELSGKPADVWSMGVTLYCMKYGRLPFRSSNVLDLNRIIREEEPSLSDETDTRFKSVMEQLLEKDPAKRITIDGLRNDPWVTDNGRKPLKDKDENTQTAVVDLTPYELQNAIQSLSGLAKVFQAVAKFKRLLKNPPVSPSSSQEEGQEEGSDNGENKSESAVPSPVMLSLRFKGARDSNVNFGRHNETKIELETTHGVEMEVESNPEPSHETEREKITFHSVQS
ncbi:hypothetical protein BGX27_002709 [Mortierella sp. AM989]|nr:hypothetical protein BGX27_002709 [Mortierella sp. AM989]